MCITKLSFLRQQRKTTKIILDTIPNEFLLIKFTETEIIESFVPNTEFGSPANRWADQKSARISKSTEYKDIVVKHPDFYYVFTTIDDYIMRRYAELCGFNVEFTKTVSTA